MEEDDKWLIDAEVQYKISQVKGRWEVSLVFINTKNPRQVLIQTIADYRTRRLAEISGRYMQQTAAKDPRGTQKLNKDAYNINDN
jgi:hypothetical protein